MKQNRPRVPKGVRDQVMNEYNHLCAICGEPRPQLHHIDEDHTNNDPLNLLPLCPNHHLTDQHNPTSKIDPGILSLFRHHKDPTILSPQFEPLFRRMQFLLDRSKQDGVAAHNQGKDLVAFISALHMSEYYYEAVNKLLFEQFTNPEAPTGGSIHLIHRLAIGTKETRRTAVDLIIEMLRYQSWNQTPNKLRKHP